MIVVLIYGYAIRYGHFRAKGAERADCSLDRIIHTVLPNVLVMFCRTVRYIIRPQQDRLGSCAVGLT